MVWAAHAGDASPGPALRRRGEAQWLRQYAILGAEPEADRNTRRDCRTVLRLQLDQVRVVAGEMEAAGGIGLRTRPLDLRHEIVREQRHRRAAHRVAGPVDHPPLQQAMRMERDIKVPER